jgi:hypothetical protein
MKCIHYARLDQREKHNTNLTPNESIIAVPVPGTVRTRLPRRGASARHHRMVLVLHE